MGRPKGGKNRNHSKEEKLALVLRNLEGESLLALERDSGIYHSQLINGQNSISKAEKKRL